MKRRDDILSAIQSGPGDGPDLDSLISARKKALQGDGGAGLDLDSLIASRRDAVLGGGPQDVPGPAADLLAQSVQSSFGAASSSPEAPTAPRRRSALDILAGSDRAVPAKPPSTEPGSEAPKEKAPKAEAAPDFPDVAVRSDLKERGDVARAVPKQDRRKRTLGETAFDVFVANAYPGFLGKKMEDRAIERMDPNAPGAQLPGGYHGGDLLGLAAYEGTAAKEVLGYLGLLGKMAGGAAKALPQVTSMPVVSRIADAIIERTGVSRELAGKVAGRVAGAIDGMFSGATEGVVFGAMRQPLEGEDVSPETLAAYAAGGALLQSIIGAAGGRGWSLADPTAKVEIQSQMSDPYATLGVKPGATRAEVNKAFREKATPFHPDRNKGPTAEDIFKRYAAAKDAITNSATPEEAIASFSKTMGTSPGPKAATPEAEAPAPTEKPAPKRPRKTPKARAESPEPSPSEGAAKARTKPPAEPSVTESVTEAKPPQEKKPGWRRRLADRLDPSRKAELDAAYTDQRTGLRSKAAYDAAKGRIDKDPNQHVLVADMANAKAGNDNKGWAFTDARLKEAADILRPIAEKHGIPERDLFSPAGDEIVVTAPTPEVLQEVGTKLKEAFGEKPIEGTGYHNWLRFGVGKTFAEAEGAANAQKATESLPSYRKGNGTPPTAEPAPSPEAKAPAETPAPEPPAAPAGAEPAPQPEESSVATAVEEPPVEKPPVEVQQAKKPAAPTKEATSSPPTEEPTTPAQKPAAELPASVVATYPSPTDGLEFRVAKRDDGKFAVSLHDTDANETLPTLRIFPDQGTAQEWAKASSEGRDPSAAGVKSTAPDAPVEGHGERTRRVKVTKGKVIPGRGASEPTITYDETYADGTEVTRAEDGTVIDSYTPPSPESGTAKTEAAPAETPAAPVAPSEGTTATTKEAPDELGGNLEAGPRGQVPERPQAVSSGSEPGAPSEGSGAAGGLGDGGASERPDSGAEPPALGVHGEGGSAGVSEGAGGGDGTARSGTATAPGEREVPRRGPAGDPVDFHIRDAHDIGGGGTVTKARQNLRAIELLKALEEENRHATVEEQAELAKYVGWGGIPQVFETVERLIPDNLRDISKKLRGLLTDEEWAEARSGTRNQHFTSVPIIRAMYDALERMGVGGGRFLEPAAGVGNFLGLTPDEWDVRWTAVEKDGLPARIGRLLYPSQQVIHSPFEKSVTPAGAYDVAISNVPFADTPVVDKAFRGARKALAGTVHDYFFAKSIEKVRPGGIVAFITSTGTMDKSGEAVRSYLAQHAELLGAIRLPNGAFLKNANTKVSTDIIFLRRRETPLAAGKQEGEAWTSVERIERPGKGGYAETFKVNEYFVRHPEMVLGDLVHGRGMYGAGEQLVELEDIDTLPKRLQDAIAKLPQDIYAPPERIDEAPSFAPADAKKGSYQIGKDGNLYVAEMGEMKPLSIPKTHVARVKSLVKMRDLTRELFRTQLDDEPPAVREKARAALNKAYDAFRKKYGPINKAVRRTRKVRTKHGVEERPYFSYPNVRHFENDPDVMLVRALEDFDAESGRAEKDALFSRDVIGAPDPLTRTDDPGEALLASLNETGRVNIDLIASKLEAEPKEALGRLGDRVYMDPASGEWETSSAYLSGNVREKLRIAEQAARQDQRFQRNVDALAKVIPEDIRPEQIRPNFGASWIHAEVYEKFGRSIGAPIRVRYNQVKNKWEVDGKRSGSRAATTGEWGTEAFPAGRIIEALLNKADITVRLPDGEGGYYVDEEATLEARTKATALADHFRSWLWESEFAKPLARRYNDLFNSWRIREYDGSHLSLPGKNLLVTLRPHQLDFVARFLEDGNVLAAHVVGAGKTYSMIGAFMEAKRLGLVSKPMIAVPNNVLPQFAASAQHLYPNARILAASAQDASKKNRELLMSRIATGDWDLIVISHPSFTSLPVSAELAVEHLQEELGDLRLFLEQARAASDRSTVKEIEKSIDSRSARIQKLLEQKATETQTVTWEELGVDALAVDEADLFKNLSFPTHMGRLLNQSVSGRAEDLMMKVRHLRKVNPTHHLLFATGTPVSNSITELWTMTRYLAPQRLEELGMDYFDNWAKTFAETTTRLEVAPEGGYRMKERLASFSNVPELVRIFRTFADVQTRDDLNLPVPELIGGEPEVLTLPASEAVQAGMGQIKERAQRVRARQVDPSEDNLLKISTDARKLTLDARLTDPTAADDAQSKGNQAVEQIFASWEATASVKGTQLVFVDFSSPASKGFNVPQDMKEKLVAKGIPASEIAFIQDAKNEKKKLDLFDKMNRGDVRVLFGSTESLGAGTNVQQRLVRLHHLDAPWRPRDIEQREGRILRQGNELYDTGKIPGVHITYYVVEGSFDSFMFQTLHRKAAFIAQAMKGDPNVREIEELDEGSLSFEEIAAITSGDPLFRERIELDSEVKQLETLERGHRQRAQRLASEVKSYTDRVKGMRSRQPDLDADAKAVQDVSGDKFRIVIDGETYTDRGPAAELLGKILAESAGLEADEFRKIGEFGGFQLRLKAAAFGNRRFELRGEADHESTVFPLSAPPAGLPQRLEHLVGQVAASPEANKARIAELESEIARSREVMAKPFDKAEKLATARARLEEVTRKMANTGDQQQPAPEASSGEAATPDVSRRTPDVVMPRRPGQEPYIREREGRVREKPKEGYGDEHDKAEHTQSTFGNVGGQEEAARAVVEIAGDFAETVDGPLDGRKRLEVLEGLRERAWVSVAGKTINSAEDAHRLLAPFFRSKTMEILHTVYTDSQGTVLSNVAVTSGAIDYVQLESDWVDQFRISANKLGASKVWVVHNHPSGDPTPSPEDVAVWRRLRAELKKDGVEVHAVVIDSDTYADIEKVYGLTPSERAQGKALQKVSGAPPEPPYERIDGPEAAHAIMALHHANDKLSILYLDTAHQTIALELHPHQKPKEIAAWLRKRASAYGAVSVIVGVTGDPIPMALGLRAEGLTGDETGGVLDVIELGPAETARAAREKLGLAWTSGTAPRTWTVARTLREKGPAYDLRSPATVRADAADEVPEIRPTPEPDRLVPEDIEGDYTDEAKALVKALPRHFRYRKDKARKTAARWRRTLSEEEREDLGAYVEGIANLRTGKSAEAIQEEVDASPKLTRAVREYRDLQEKARKDLNAFVAELHGPEYIKYLEDYLLHFYTGPAKKRAGFARGWAKKVPSAAKRRIPTLEAAVEAGLTPITQDIAELHQLWAELNWKGAVNQRFVYELAHIRNAEGQPVIQKPKDAPPDWVYVDHPAIQKVYARKDENGNLHLWRGGAMVDPEVHKPLRQVFERPITWKPLRAVETINAFSKKAALSLSFFHHFALTESAQASLARWWNPVRGLALAEKGLRGGIKLGTLRVTTPHREGLRLLESKEFIRDATLHGLNIDPIPDVMAGRVARAVRGLEARTRGIPGLGYLTRSFRRFNEGWDNLLWNRYYTGLKAFTYYDIVAELMRQMPDDAGAKDVRLVKEKVAELINDMFGGQEWESKFWLTPQGRQLLHVGFLAPDWTLSNLSVAGKPIRDIGDKTTRHVLGRYWRNMLLSFAAIVAGVTRLLNGKWPWEQEPGHRLDIDVTPIMHAMAKAVPNWLPDWVPGADESAEADPRRYFIKPGKQFREVLRYLSSPVDIVGAKLSPIVQIAIEQMTGHQPGQAGWEMPWVQEDLTWYESIPSRISSVMGKFVPFAVRGNNFAFTFPMSRGMSWYKAQKAYEDVIRAQVDPTLYDRLMPLRDADRLKKEIDEGAVLNGLDPEEQYRQANTKVRSEYYARMWRAVAEKNMDEAEGVAAILYRLGADASTLRASGERRGLTPEQVENAVRLLPGRYVRPARKARPTRERRRR